uniref:Uncharacterized protein n=1 Tax=Romanomermis culicivorax TaxID=13658 RepID=A0A915I4Z1_ROMCU
MTQCRTGWHPNGSAKLGAPNLGLRTLGAEMAAPKLRLAKQKDIMLKKTTMLWCPALIGLIAVTYSLASDAVADDGRPFAGIVKRPGARFLGGGLDFWGGRGLRSVYGRRYSSGGSGNGRWNSLVVPPARKRPSFYVPISSYFKDDDDNDDDDDDNQADVDVSYNGYGKRARYAYPSWLRNGRYSGR